MAQRAGLRVRALIELKTVAMEMVTANCLKSVPVMPLMAMVGMKTARRTRVVATTGPLTSSMAFSVASFGLRPSSIQRVVFSTTTMASSTTMPMTRTRPKRVSWLNEYPSRSITAKVPMRETGMVASGMRVARKFWRKRKTVRTTRMRASTRVWTTPAMEARMMSVLS
jgi:hypothetical protein